MHPLLKGKSPFSFSRELRETLKVAFKGAFIVAFKGAFKGKGLKGSF